MIDHGSAFLLEPILGEVVDSPIGPLVISMGFSKGKLGLLQLFESRGSAHLDWFAKWFLGVSQHLIQ